MDFSSCLSFFKSSFTRVSLLQLSSLPFSSFSNLFFHMVHEDSFLLDDFSCLINYWIFLPFFVVLRGKSFFILFYRIVDFFVFQLRRACFPYRSFLPPSLFSENLSLWGRWEFLFMRWLIFSVCGWRKVCLVIEALFPPFLLWKSLFIRSTRILPSWMTFRIRMEQSVFSHWIFLPSLPSFRIFFHTINRNFLN